MPPSRLEPPDMTEHDVIFDAMGSHVRLLIGEPGPGMAPPPAAAEQARQLIVEFDATLSRVKPESELCALNADPRERVPASELLRTAVKAGLEAADRSGGLVDPTLVGEIESAGYVASRAGVPGAPLGAALDDAPARRPARPNPSASWQRFEVDDASATISRPPVCASIPAAPARAWPPISSPNCWAVTRASSSTAVV